MTEIAAWPEVHNALEIDCSPEAMDAIRRHAVAQTPHGRCAGGLLCGERAGARVCIRSAQALELTGDEIRAARRRIAEGLPAVGWYIARRAGEIDLTPAEISVFRELFPTEWQLTLLLTGTSTLHAAFFFRDADGRLVRTDEGVFGAVASDLPLPEPVPAPMPHPPVPPDPAPVREQEPSRLSSTLGWLLIALVALLFGAAVYEFQVRHVIPVSTPHSAPRVTEIP